MMMRFMVDPALKGQEIRDTSQPAKRIQLNSLQFANRSARVIAVTGRPNGPAGVESVSDGEGYPVVGVSSQLKQSLGLPRSGLLRVKQVANRWSIGPCLGIFVTAEPSIERRFGEQTGLLEDISRLAYRRGLDVVVITPGFSGTGRGWRFEPGDGIWRYEPAPLPDVVLRRSGRFHETEAKVSTDLKWFEKSGRLHSLPRMCSNKWTFYQSVRSDMKIRPHLPLTREVTSGAELLQAVSEFQDIYVKPVNGAQGAFIHRLTRLARNVVSVTSEQRLVPRRQDRVSRQFRPQTRIVRTSLKNLKDLNRFWDSLQRSFRRWIAQQSVDLLRTADGRPVDFRWLVQYGSRPEVIGRVARRGGSPGGVTTNLHTGGAAGDALLVLRKLSIANPEQVIADIDTLAIDVVERLRTEHGPFAEVGVDIGVDRQQTLFVFEVNPTPGRRMLRSLGGNVRELSLVKLVEYAIRTTGFEDGKSQ